MNDKDKEKIDFPIHLKIKEDGRLSILSGNDEEYKAIVKVIEELFHCKLTEAEKEVKE